MTGAYIAYPYDADNLPVTDADMQAALSSYELLLPSQTGNSGKYLTTNGTAKSWATIDLSTKQDAAAFLTTLVGIGGTSGSGNLARVTSPVLVTPTASRYNLSANTNVSEQASGVVQIGTTAANAFGSIACANVTASGTVTCGSAGYAMASMGGGDIRLNNGTSDTPGIHWVTANNANWGIDSSGGSLRLVRNLDESGGVVFATWAAAQYQLSSTTTTSLRLTSTGASGKSFDFASDASGSFTIGDGTNNLLTLTSTLATFLRAVVLGVYTVGTLPSASANTRARAFVADSNLAFNSTNLGSTVTAGGSTLVPVFSNGTNWVIG